MGPLRVPHLATGNREIDGSVLRRKVLKGWPTMRSSTQSVANTPPPVTPNIPQPSLCAERIYQVLTIAFMLLLLGSLWVFR
jgi:hypothetical protein